jgi:hypothetical protein
MLRAFSDLIFSYITWYGIYMPDGNINLISSLYDFVYVMSYLVAALGFVAYGLLTAEAPGVDAITADSGSETAAGNFILISTDRAGRIISFSDNFLALLKRTDGQNIKGAPLYELLGLDENSVKKFEAELLQQGVVDAMPARVITAAGAGMDVRLSALAVYYEGDSFRGANIIINTLAPLGVDDNLSAESQGMVKAILARTGNPQREARAALITYFNAQMRMLDDLVHQYSGKTIAQTMRMAINDAASKNGWQVRKEGADFVILDQTDIAALAGVMSVLLSAARVYAIDMVGMQLVVVEVNNINTFMNPAVMNTVDNYGLRLDAGPPGQTTVD